MAIQIPEYKPQVDAKTLPTVRFSTQADPNAFGAGVAKAKAGFGSQLEKTSDVLTDNLIKMQEEKNARVVLDASNQWQQKVNDYLNNPNTGILQRKGKAADGLYDQSQKDLAKIKQEVLGTLQNDRQRLAFEKFVDGREIAATETVSRHQAREMEVWGKETREGIKFNAIDAAAKNHGNIAYIDQQIDAGLRGIAASMVGKHAPELILAEQKQFVSDLHENVIRAKLDAYDAAGARTYFETHKDEILSTSRQRINPDIQKVERVDKSQQLNKELWAKYGYDVEAARADLEKRGLPAPELEYYVGQYKQEVSFKHAVEDRLQEKSFDDTLDNLSKLKAAGQLTPETATKTIEKSGLHGRQLLSIQAQALSMMGLSETGRPKQTSREVWEEVNLAVSTGKMNITQLKMRFGHLLSDNDYEHFFNAILKGTNSDEGFGWAADVDRLRKKAGVKDEDVGNLWAKIAKEIDAFKGKYGRAPTIDEREDIVKDLVGKSVIEQRRFWFNKEEFNFKITPPVGAPAGTMWNTKINGGKGGWVFQDPTTGKWNEWIP